MAQLGRNAKITVAQTHHDTVRSVFADLFGCTVIEPAPGVELYEFADGSRVGAYFVSDDTALSREQIWHGAWLEFSVADLGVARGALAELGVETFEYMGEEKTYYRLPGGQCFRIAALDAGA